MAGRISELTALSGGLALTDLFEALDVSDTALGAAGSNRKALMSDLVTLIQGNGFPKTLVNSSTADQGAGFSSDTYLTNSNISIPSGYPVVGTKYKLTVALSKTAAGTAAPVLSVRIGTAGTTADTAILTFTFGAGSAAADNGILDVFAHFRTVGSGTSAVLVGVSSIRNVLASTGLTNATKVRQNTSSGFNSTTANLIIGASWNGGTSASHTVQLVRAELML